VDEDKSSDKKSIDYTYPCTMTRKEKIKKFKTFGRISDDDDGKIIKDENEEIIEVDRGTFVKLFHYYGQWWKFAALFIMIFCSRYIKISFEVTMAEWANADKEV